MMESNSSADPFAQYRSPNYIEPDPIVYVPEPEFNYLIKDFLTEDTVPGFAKAVFIDRFIPNTLKQEFLYNFVIQYITDNNFKTHNHGKYLVFFNKKRYIITDNISNVIHMGDKRDGKLCIHIGELPVFGLVKK
jgi:hypothetical protein